MSRRRPHPGGRRPPTGPGIDGRCPAPGRPPRGDAVSSATEALRTLERRTVRLRDHRPADARHGRPGVHRPDSSVAGIGAQVVMVTAHASVASAVEAMRHGAFDYIEKPFDADQLERSGVAGHPPRPAGRRPERRSSGRRRASAGGDDRLQRRRCRRCGTDRPGRPHVGNRADHRRERDRQGTGGPGDPRRQPPPRRPAGQPELPRAVGAV